MKNNTKTNVLLGLVLTCSMAHASLWQEIDETVLTKDYDTVETKYYRANLADIKNRLENFKTIEIPTSDGKLQKFRITASSVMAPALEAKYPDIKSYKLYGIDDSDATARITTTADDFSGLVSSKNTRYMITPQDSSSSIHRVSSFSPNTSDVFENCSMREHPDTLDEIDQESTDARRSSSVLPSDRHEYTRRRYNTGNIIQYRIAIATTYEFTQKVGGTKAKAMSAVASIMNRVNELYERELGVSFQLIPETDQFFYTNSNDPYSGGNGDRVDQNTKVMNSVRTKIDLGHVFGTGGGGVANLSSLCSTIDQAEDDGTYKYKTAIFKAGAGSYTGSPHSDGFFMTLIHEMGHQLGAVHTYGGKEGGCDNFSSNYFETGSGSSIMSYHGVCGGVNLSGSDQPVFHVASFDSMKWKTFLNVWRNKKEQDAGEVPYCKFTELDIGNDYFPVVEAGADHTIPISTPFELEAVASDGDGDTLSYTWDEWNDQISKEDRRYNRVTSSTFGQDLKYNSLMRSFMPVSSPKRHFPKPKVLFDEATAQEVKEEALPTTDRTMKYTVTARDGKGEIEYDSLTLTATTSAGPFTVTSHANAQTLNASSSTTLSWNVAGTNSGAVNCANVDIEMLMYDSSGEVCERSLMNSVANDGSQSITLLNLNTDKARFKVSCSDNVFFAVSNANIKIQNASKNLNCATSQEPIDPPEPNTGIVIPAITTYLLF